MAKHTAMNDTFANDEHITLGYSIKGVFYMCLNGHVERKTEKAIQISHPDTKIKIWLPKAALIRDNRIDSHKSYDVAKWFKGDDWFYKFVDSVGTIVG